MNSPAPARPPGRRRLALIVAGVLALLGSFVITAPAQAGYYGESYYGSNPCSHHCGYSPYRYAPRYYGGCSACGCYRHCYSGRRPGLVYERRYVEREYVERRYGWPAHHYYRHGCGYSPCGGYRSWSRPYPYGYGGVRGWRAPYGSYRYGYEPSVDRYDESPRPPLPVWGGSGYEAAPYGYDGDQ
jgi:hypothetical protein